MVLAFPMMFLSGAAIPLEILSDKVVNISRFMPLYHIVTFMRGLWIGESWSEHYIAIFVLIGILVVGTAISAKLFKWE
jgi:ABC-2 type transport system permease protein